MKDNRDIDEYNSDLLEVLSDIAENTERIAKELEEINENRRRKEEQDRRQKEYEFRWHCPGAGNNAEDRCKYFSEDPDDPKSCLCSLPLTEHCMYIERLRGKKK